MHDIRTPTQYDGDIVRAWTRFMPNVDPLYGKCQLWQESRLQPDAVSRVGAEGIAQFMPTTWPEVREGMHYPDSASPLEPYWAIPAAAWYLRQQWNKWKSQPRSPMDRLRLAWASYNAGAGHIIEAQQLAHGALDAKTILSRLREVTGEANAHETLEYVRLIEEYYKTLTG